MIENSCLFLRSSLSMLSCLPRICRLLSSLSKYPMRRAFFKYQFWRNFPLWCPCGEALSFVDSMDLASFLICEHYCLVSEFVQKEDICYLEWKVIATHGPLFGLSFSELICLSVCISVLLCISVPCRGISLFLLLHF